MMRRRKPDPGRVCILAGVLMILVSAVWLMSRLYTAQVHAEQLRTYAEALCRHIPEPQPAVIGHRTENRMPSLGIEGEDFIAVLDIPAWNAVFPVGASWGEQEKFPCRFDGSAYDGTLILGTNNRKGQLDFVKEISVGNVLYLTDMTGARFAYTVKDIRYSDHADGSVLYEEEYDLTIFVKNLYAFEYILIFCAA